MEFTVLDPDFKAVRVIDEFESAIWTDRYCGAGDFEIYLPLTERNLGLMLCEDYYLYNGDTDRMMIIEDVNPQTDAETGKKLVVTGRSLESLLDRRIVWEQTQLSGNFQEGIAKLLRESFFSSTDADRRVGRLNFMHSTDPAITSLTVSAQFTGDSVYDAIKSLCEANKLGFKVALSDDNFMVISLYAGKDRSYGQFANPYVIFSPNFDNLVNSNYFSSKRNLKTVALVAGEGEGSARKKAVVAAPGGAGSGLNRRELYVDARDLSSDDGAIAPAKYTEQLIQRGRAKLTEHVAVKTFEGQVDSMHKFVYGVDFFMGDVVQIANEYGVESTSRVTEIVRSQNAEGFQVFPTFTAIE